MKIKEKLQDVMELLYIQTMLWKRNKDYDEKMGARKSITKLPDGTYILPGGGEYNL